MLNKNKIKVLAHNHIFTVCICMCMFVCLRERVWTPLRNVVMWTCGVLLPPSGNIWTELTSYEMLERVRQRRQRNTKGCSWQTNRGRFRVVSVYRLSHKHSLHSSSRMCFLLVEKVNLCSLKDRVTLTCCSGNIDWFYSSLYNYALRGKQVATADVLHGVHGYIKRTIKFLF